MPKSTLTNADYCRAAKKLWCQVAAIKAVAEVESRGKGFYANGFPTILFERHIFRKYTKGRYNASHPHLSGPQGNYGAAGQHQINKFNEAFALNPTAAMKACSWGKFQIMGFNHEVCGYETVGEFVDAMKESEGKHLDAFVAFVIGNKLDDYLRKHQWLPFVERYNGAGHAKNNYVPKITRAFAKAVKENIDCSNSAATSANPSTQTAVTALPVTETTDAATSPPINSNETKVIDAPAKEGSTATITKTAIFGVTVPAVIVTAIEGMKSLIADGYLSASEIGSTVVSLIKDNYKFVFSLLIAFIGFILVKKAFKQITLWLQMWIASDPKRYDVEVQPK